MRSLPRINLTFSVIGASLLAQPCIDERFPACRGARVEHVADRLFVEADQGDHDFVVGGEPADDADGNFGIKRMCDSPEFVPARLPDSLEGRGFFGWLLREVGEGLQQRDRDGQQSAGLLFGVIEPAVELVCPVDDHISIMSSGLYKVKFISAGKGPFVVGLPT